MSSISLILALWQADVLSSEVVTSWADHEISETETPSFELIQLSLHGPQVCLEQTAENFAVIPTELSYLDLFSIHAEEALDSLQQSTKFLEWVCHHCIGEDVRFPEVAFSYHLDNLYQEFQIYFFFQKLYTIILNFLLHFESLPLLLL